MAFLQGTPVHDQSVFGFVVMMLRVPNWAVVFQKIEERLQCGK